MSFNIHDYLSKLCPVCRETITSYVEDQVNDFN